MKRFLLVTGLIALVGTAGYFTIRYWSYVFSIKVTGVIVDVQHVGATTAILNTDAATNKRSNNKDIFSFAVGIQDQTGEIHTASSEDRQWAVAKVGQCAEAKYFPYPPWQFGKAGTYFNARLLHLRDCPEGLQFLDKLKKENSDQK